MENLLTKGFIKRVLSGGTVDSPVVQIVSTKRMPANQDRIRMCISDGQHTSSFAMLATQLNYLVENNEIKPLCIARIDRYVCNNVQGNKKVIVVIEITILHPSEEVRIKLGNPVNYDAIYAANQAASQQQPQTGSLRPSLATRNPPNAGISMQTGTYQMQASGPVSAPPGMANVHPISSLTPYQNKWTIRARVTSKSNIRTWSNARGEGKLFSFDLLDHSGEIRVTAFNEQCDKFHSMIEVNNLYFVSLGTLKPANKQYTSLKNDYEMTLNSQSQIVPCHDEADIPSMQFDFVSIDQLENTEADKIIDVMGVCKHTEEMSTVTHRSSGRELKKRDIQLVDESCKEIRLTLWGEQAETFDGSVCPVIAIKGARVSDYSGKSLSTLNSSTLVVNPDMKEAHRLKGWFQKEGSLIQTSNLSGQAGGASGSGALGGSFKSFGEVKQEGLGSRDQADYYSNKVTTVLVRKENCLYPACPSDGCNKKVIDMNNGLYRCEKCNREYDSFKWQLMVSLNFADCTDNQWVTSFREQGEILLNTKSQELGSLRENNPEAYDKFFTDAAFKEFIVKLRVKMETYNDESRLKTTLVNVSPLDCRDYNRKLIAEIRTMLA